jgi:CheY-like chemotaxis protein
MMENNRFHGGFHKVERVFDVLGAPLSPQKRERRILPPPETIRILAIDDDPEILYGYKHTFESHQQSAIQPLLEVFQASQEQLTQQAFEVDTVTGGESGLEKVKQELLANRPYSLLLLDMRMPGGWDGLKTARKIREIDPDVRIVILSAYRDYTLSKIREEIGGHFVLHHKPYVQDELVQLSTFMGLEWQQSRSCCG